MSWRKWLVRGFVFLVVSGLAGAGVLYQRWTNPESVRLQVIDQLGVHFVGVDIRLASAHVRLLGGISFQDLSLIRTDDPSQAELAHIPDGIIYPDKEEVLNGRLTIRKIELHQPRFRAQRGPDGHWNLKGVLAPPRLDQPFPTMVIQGGTIVVEDAFGTQGQPPLEITGVNLTLVNDPLPTINFQGNGASALAGGVQLQGKVQRASGDTALSFQVNDIPVGHDLIGRLGAYWPDLPKNAPEFAGTAGLRGELGYTAGAARPWMYNVRLQLAGSKLHHPKVPLDLENVRATLHCLDGRLELEAFTARSGSTEVALTGSLQSLQPDANFQGVLTVKHLTLSPQVFDGLPPDLQKIAKEYSPAGVVSLTYHCTRTGGGSTKRCVLHPEGLSASFFKFPYTLEGIIGTIEQEADSATHREEIRVDLVGKAGGQPVFIKGTISGEAPSAAVGLKIWGDNLTLDDKLLAALSPHPKYKALAKTFHPTGQANFEAHVYRPRGGRDFTNRYLIRFHQVKACYDVFPYPLEDVSGVLDILPDHWEFYNFHGVHAGGEIFTAGRFQPGPKGEPGRLLVQVWGKNVALNPELKAAFKGPDLTKAGEAWEILHPSGRMNFSALVNRLGDDPPEVEVGITALNCSLKPDFFKCQFEDVAGNFFYSRHWVSFDHLQARHGKSVLRIDKGQVYVKPEGGVWAELTDLQGDPLAPDGELLEALPPMVRETCEALQLRAPFTLKKTKLTLATAPEAGGPPDVYWDGALEFRDTTLKAGVPWERVTGLTSCRGRYNGRELEGLVGNFKFDQASLLNQPFRDLQGAFEIRKDAPNVLILPGVFGRLYGGEIYGPVRIELGPKLHYEVNLTASQIKLEEFGRRNLGPDAPISGLATARLHLVGNGPEIADLTGRGGIDVENGRMYNLPLLLDLLKFLSLRPPDGTAFEEAHTAFTIRGQRVAVNRLDLFGNSISLRGQGGMNLDGTDINLDFFAVWARVVQFLPPIIKEIPQDLSKYLLKIKMRGQLNDVHLTQEPVPVLVDPIKGLLEKMKKLRKGDISTPEPRAAILDPLRNDANGGAARPTNQK